MTCNTNTRRIALMLTLATLAGCEDENSKLARMADDFARRQAEQTQQVVELQREVAEGSRQLVEADARAREDMAALHREVGRQQDQLEADRRAFAAQRRMDPIVASAITNAAWLLACLLPLVLCWYLLHSRPNEDDAAVNDVLIGELIAEQPVLLPKPRAPATSIECQPEAPRSLDVDQAAASDANS